MAADSALGEHQPAQVDQLPRASFARALPVGRAPHQIHLTMDHALRREQAVPERRYDEHEVAAIFERATARLMEGDRSSASGSKAVTMGLTLTELKRIGSEVGIPTEMIEEGAALIDLGERPVAITRRVLGMPAQVAGTFALPRDMTDREWEELVVIIREAFSAHGRISGEGSLRSWRNGNLEIRLEPTSEGQRLHMQTRKDDAMALGSVGGLLGAVGIGFGVLGVVVGKPELAIAMPALMGGMGAVMVGVGAITLPKWGRERVDQMNRVAGAAMQMIRRAPKHDEPLDGRTLIRDGKEFTGDDEDPSSTIGPRGTQV